MRLHLLVFPASVLVAIAVGVACTSTAADNSCACPDVELAPVVIAVSCPGASPAPVVTVSGPCTTAPYGDGGLTLNPTGAGACRIVATAADGATSSVEVTISAEPLACGSNPTGCGVSYPVSGATDGVVTLGGAACADAGDAGDGGVL
jgi:hypothetical protein